jgi:hypothetical protein
MAFKYDFEKWKSKMELSGTERMFLQEWGNLEFNEVLNDIIGCHYAMGTEMTREQANQFEQIAVLFPFPPPPHKSGRVRTHYSIKAVWDRVWEFLTEHPTFRSRTVSKILSKFWVVQDS